MREMGNYQNKQKATHITETQTVNLTLGLIEEHVW